VIKKFKEFLMNENEEEKPLDIENFKKLQKVNNILKKSGFDEMKKPPKKEITKYLPKFEELLQIPEFAELKKKFDLVQFSDFDLRRDDENGLVTQRPERRTSSVNFISNLINKRTFRKADISLPAESTSSGWPHYRGTRGYKSYSDSAKELIDKLAIRLSAPAPGYVTIYGNPNVDPVHDYHGGFHATVITKDHPFYTREEKLKVINIIEVILYASAINLGPSAIKSILEGNINITNFIKTYGTSINDELSIEACKRVVSLFDDIDMKAFFKAIVNIPDNKSMDLITAVLDNPKLSKKFMDYDAQNPGLLEDPEEIKKLVGKLK
jgi:hypothetical protein